MSKSIYEAMLRPLLFLLPPEEAHCLGIWGLSMMDSALVMANYWRRRVRAERAVLETKVAGLHFPNPLGLAAGFDKDAEAMAGLFALGFGSLEVGTVTPQPQPGNPLPRIFRLREQQAFINRMGFNSKGMHALAARLREMEWRPAPLGVNIGKNKDTANEVAVNDYRACAQELSPLADYVVVNLSSPNTPGLRALQQEKPLEQLLRVIRKVTAARPLFLKIAPELSDEAVDAVVDVVCAAGVNGLICTNTTVARPRGIHEVGGLSGKPLFDISTHVLRRAYRKSNGLLALVGVGGIFDGEDAWRKICAGASLVQIYSGFIYGGPGLPRRMLNTLETKVTALGLNSIAQAVGRDA